MTFEADSPLVDVVEPSLGYRRAGWGRAGIGRHLAFWTPGGSS